MNVLENFLNRGVRLDSLFKFTDLDIRVQKHVQKVHATLAVSVLVCALGVYLSPLLRLHPYMTAFLGFGCLMGLTATPSTSQNLGLRYGWMFGFTFLEGLSIGPLIHAVLDIHPSVVLMALGLTFIVFASFSGAALMAKRRSMLYLSSFCSIGLLGLTFISLVSIFSRAEWMFWLNVYGGLILFSAYVLFDTQLIVERAAAGDDDHIKSALELFMDALSIFIRILIILLDKKEKDQRESSRRSKNK